MNNNRFVIVDVFTEKPLAGNQLAVFTNAVGLNDQQMQALALETGFSETVFVLPAESDGDLRVRIFTPQCELPFAGHPVLGTAFAVAGPLQSLLMRIETGMGTVPVVLEREGAKLVFGRMRQPVPTVQPWGDAGELLAALGVQGSQLPVEVYDNGIRHVFVALGSHAEVRALTPDHARLAQAAPNTGVNVFAVEDGRAKTRMFWSDAGVEEDAATGSAAGPLAVHLARHGLMAWGDTVEISQGAEIGRPSTLYATAHGSADGIESVEVGGSAVVVGRGEFKF
ncbi:MAG: 2,3-dihydro-3-hydroxyanthranilate isomerase [Actinobacteria bacterium HGW-Actinobacteria-7]|jgi:trans-2,3-dihydro-3-hydroxyanthranilate isomerase|nr:MAG: 2,3-dihydro-3-hydroxyanthranilate isomerase [Actinobacteria bacterium HGW-Actinobacteria-7]